MITIKSPRELETMGRAGRIVAETLALVRSRTVPGITTADLDRIAEDFIRSHAGATPSFKGLYGFPATLCTSINAEVVHGIPSPKRVLHEGDIVSVDCGVCVGGLHGDSAITVPVGAVAPNVKALLEVTSRPSRRASRRPGAAPRSATSATPSRRWPRGRATGWCGSWWDTASARSSTRSRRSPTSGGHAPGRG